MHWQRQYVPTFFTLESCIFEIKYKWIRGLIDSISGAIIWSQKGKAMCDRNWKQFSKVVVLIFWLRVQFFLFPNLQDIEYIILPFLMVIIAYIHPIRNGCLSFCFIAMPSRVTLVSAANLYPPGWTEHFSNSYSTFVKGSRYPCCSRWSPISRIRMLKTTRRAKQKKYL